MAVQNLLVLSMRFLQLFVQETKSTSTEIMEDQACDMHVTYVHMTCNIRNASLSNKWLTRVYMHVCTNVSTVCTNACTYLCIYICMYAHVCMHVGIMYGLTLSFGPGYAPDPSCA